MLKQIVAAAAVTAAVLPRQFVADPARAMTVADYESRKAETNIAFYVAGVGAGYYYTMKTAEAVGQNRLYCPGSETGPPGQFYQLLLDHYLALQRFDPTTSIEVVLLTALIKEFPC